MLWSSLFKIAEYEIELLPENSEDDPVGGGQAKYIFLSCNCIDESKISAEKHVIRQKPDKCSTG